MRFKPNDKIRFFQGLDRFETLEPCLLYAHEEQGYLTVHSVSECATIGKCRGVRNKCSRRIYSFKEFSSITFFHCIEKDAKLVSKFTISGPRLLYINKK
jgi:hypothetical protein